MPCFGVDRLQIAFQRAIEHHAAGGCQRASPGGEQLLVGPHDLAGLAVPGNEIAHIGLAFGREHRHGGTDISLTGSVGYLVGLIVHADMVGRDIEQLRVRAIGRGLFVLGAKRRRADALGVGVFAVVLVE